MKPLDYIVKYWVVIVAITAGITSATIAGQKIKTLEEAVRKQVAQADQVHEMKIEQKVLIARTNALVEATKEQKEDAKEQRRLLTQILLKLEKPN